MTQNPNLAALSAAGVSVWLDDLSRDRLESGNQSVDLQAARSQGHAYDTQLAELAERGADVETAVQTLTTDDVRAACDLLTPQWVASGGVDGRVSVEGDLARRTTLTKRSPRLSSCGRSSTGRTFSSTK